MRELLFKTLTLTCLFLSTTSEATLVSGRITDLETDEPLIGATICGKSNGVTLESDETETALKTGVSTLQNIETSTALLSEKNIYTNDDFIINNTVNPDLVIATYEDAKSRCTWITGSWVK